MTINFNELTEKEVFLLTDCSDLYLYFWLEQDYLYKSNVTLQEYNNKFNDQTLIYDNNNVYIKSNRHFRIKKSENSNAYFELYTNDDHILEIDNLTNFNLIAQLSGIGEAIYNVAKKDNITTDKIIRLYENY